MSTAESYHRIAGPRRTQTRHYAVSTTQKNIDLLTDITQAGSEFLTMVSDVTLYFQLSNTSGDTIDETQQDALNTAQQVFALAPWQQHCFKITRDEVYLHVKASAVGSLYIHASSNHL